ncbi:MAG: hypothetical protein ACTSSM_10360, partial [Promethearchaeota archaeon]
DQLDFYTNCCTSILLLGKFIEEELTAHERLKRKIKFKNSFFSFSLEKFLKEKKSIENGTKEL